jgi:hypothetical protein
MTTIEAARDSKLTELKLQMKCEAARKHGDIRPVGNFASLDDCFTLNPGHGLKPSRLAFWYNVATHTTKMIVRHLITPDVQPLYDECIQAGVTGCWFFSFRHQDFMTITSGYAAGRTIADAKYNATDALAEQLGISRQRFDRDYRVLCMQECSIIR